MRLISAFLSASALLVAAPVLAKESEQPKDAKPASEKKICKKIQVSYSRLGSQRECRTAAEWDAIRREAGDNRSGTPSESQRIN